MFVLLYAALPALTSFALRQDLGPPCPEYPMRARPSDIHFAPGLVEHESWLEFPVPRSFAGWYALCLDGAEIETGSGVLDFHTGTARFHVQTKWIDTNWLGRSLDGLRDTDRWELRLLCAPDWVCQ
jgi:hypothetical protein